MVNLLVFPCIVITVLTVKSIMHQLHFTLPELLTAHGPDFFFFTIHERVIFHFYICFFEEWVKIGVGLFWSAVCVCVCVCKRRWGCLRLAERPKRGCGGRFVEMVIICRIDLAVARAAGTHKLTRTHVHTHSQTLTDSHAHRRIVAWQE